MTNNPTELLAKAIDAGVGAEQIQSLIDLVKYNGEQAARRAFNEAFTKFQAELPKIPKNGHVDYFKRDGTRVCYDHALFHEEVEILRPLLKKHGFSFRHELDDRGDLTMVTCVLAHKKGHQEVSGLPAPPDTSGGKSGPQGIGSTVTYLKRYTLEAVLGLTTEDYDDDGAGDDPGLSGEQIEKINQKIGSANDGDRLLQKILHAYKVENIGQIDPSKVDEVLRRCDHAIQEGI